jgi:hypothetical protein
VGSRLEVTGTRHGLNRQHAWIDNSSKDLCKKGQGSAGRQRDTLNHSENLCNSDITQDFQCTILHVSLASIHPYSHSPEIARAAAAAVMASGSGVLTPS